MFKEFYNECMINKKYISLYLIFILATFFSMMTLSNYNAPKLEILIFIVVAILGIFLINYHNDKNLFKVAFIAILCFGLICAFLMPMMDACDEEEHFERAFLTSQGDFLPSYQNNSYNSIQSVLVL